MTGLSAPEAATARLRRLFMSLRQAGTLRRHEKRLNTYLLRMLCLFLLLVVLPVQKLLQLGPVDAVLALLKVGVGGALAAGLLWLAFAAEAWLRRRKETKA